MVTSYRRSFRPKEYVDIEDVLCTRESDKALLCVINNDETWVPKSQIDMDESEVKAEGDEGTLVLSKWFAEKINVPERLMSEH